MDSIDVAWQEATAALPEHAYIYGIRIASAVRVVGRGDVVTGWRATAESSHNGHDQSWEGRGTSPAAALRDLTVKLRS